MWGRKDEPEETNSPEQAQAEPQSSDRAARPIESQTAAARPRPVESRIGKSIHLKGEVSGKEDLQVDGILEGKIQLGASDLRIGSNGQVRADVVARSVVIDGALHGNVKASEKIEIRKTGSLEGDIVTVGISIEEGGVFRGSVDIVKREQASAGASAIHKPAASDTSAKSATKTGTGSVRAAKA